MTEGEPGKYYEFRIPEVTLGSFSVLSVLKVTEGNLVSTEDLVIIFEGEDNKADTLIGLGIIKRELEAGKKVGIAFNPEEEIKYPEEWG